MFNLEKKNTGQITVSITFKINNLPFYKVLTIFSEVINLWNLICTYLFSYKSETSHCAMVATFGPSLGKIK